MWCSAVKRGEEKVYMLCTALLRETQCRYCAAPEISLIKHRQMFPRLFIRLCSIGLLASFQTFCSFSSILIPVISFELISLILQIVHLFDRYPIDSSENNGGSSSFDSFSLTVYSSRSRTLLNTNAHTHTHAHSCPCWMIELSYMIMGCPSVTFAFGIYWLHSVWAGCFFFLKIQTLQPLSTGSICELVKQAAICKKL